VRNVSASAAFLLAAYRFESLLERGDEVADVFDSAVLVIEAIVHFLVDVPLVFLELAQGVILYLCNAVTLPRQLAVQLVDQFSLHLETFFLLSKDGLFDLAAIFSKIFEDFSFLLDTGVLLSFEVHEIFVHLIVDGCKLVVKALNTVTFLLVKHVLKMLDAVVTPFVLVCLVLLLIVELLGQFVVHVDQLSVVALLVSFERLIDLFALIDCVLLDVLDFSLSEKEQSEIGRV
jgi:hypothetical protein